MNTLKTHITTNPNLTWSHNQSRNLTNSKHEITKKKSTNYATKLKKKIRSYGQKKKKENKSKNQIFQV